VTVLLARAVRLAGVNRSATAGGEHSLMPNRQTSPEKTPGTYSPVRSD